MFSRTLTTFIAMPVVVLRQRKSWRRKEGTNVRFEVSCQMLIRSIPDQSA